MDQPCPHSKKSSSTSTYPLLITASAFHFPLEQPDIWFKVHPCFFITEKFFLVNTLKVILSVTYCSFMRYKQPHNPALG